MIHDAYIRTNKLHDKHVLYKAVGLKVTTQ